MKELDLTRWKFLDPLGSGHHSQVVQVLDQKKNKLKAAKICHDFGLGQEEAEIVAKLQFSDFFPKVKPYLNEKTVILIMPIYDKVNLEESEMLGFKIS